ncbi:MAG: hypothetical protein ACUVV0_05255 [Anaerolineae bacterium]
MTEIKNAIRKALDEGELPCARAHGIARRLKVPPLEVSQAADEMGIRISRCQLGLFGYGDKAKGEHKIVRPAPNVDEVLARVLLNSAPEGNLPCATAWAIAAKRKIKRLEIANAAEALGLRIKQCQLGCF